ncbi:AAA family ATPase [Candidatus Sumerlaeota bacterium]|nr:AAA family ATPase [Candidatus Sumerlaeota bacterium]
MSAVPILAFFNNKGGVGKTSLVYHIAHMCAILDIRVLAADLDPQSNLTSAFLPDEELEDLWNEKTDYTTLYKCVHPLIKGTGDVDTPAPYHIDDNIFLLPGDLQLSGFEDQLSESWPKCNDGDERAFRVTSAFWRLLQQSASDNNVQLILMDLGPNLGALNRVALISADYVVMPLAPDLFSLQGLKNLGPTLKRWNTQWKERSPRADDMDFEVPLGDISPLGYVIMQHSERLKRPTKAYAQWAEQVPALYREYVLQQAHVQDDLSPSADEYCLSFIKHFRTLMPLAQEARKPIFLLKAADGVLGGHNKYVQAAYDLFKSFTEKLLRVIGLQPSEMIQQSLFSEGKGK